MRRWFVLAGMIVILLGALLGWNVRVAAREKREQAFLDTLKGEIVFLRRDGDDILNIYKIPARGGAATLLFHNDERTPFKDFDTINQNSLAPRWSKDGKAIVFVASRGQVAGEKSTGGWKRMVMKTDGSGVRILGDTGDEDMLSMDAREEGIVVEQGDVFVLDEAGQKKQIYDFWGYDGKLNRGASEASFSPDAQEVLFQSCSWFSSCGIYVADRTGEHIARVTDGTEPDWRY
ncbi:MAG: hypothetical protein PHI23_02675 [Candidatus Peribacteraceae bacterium]|nr:hypothetical protein [Candidatus Peribacteraceae bacterium]